MQGRRSGRQLVRGQDLVVATAVRAGTEPGAGEDGAPVGYAGRRDVDRVRLRDAVYVQRLAAAGRGAGGEGSVCRARGLAAVVPERDRAARIRGYHRCVVGHVRPRPIRRQRDADARRRQRILVIRRVHIDPVGVRLVQRRLGLGPDRENCARRDLVIAVADRRAVELDQLDVVGAAVDERGTDVVAPASGADARREVPAEQQLHLRVGRRRGHAVGDRDLGVVVA